MASKRSEQKAAETEYPEEPEPFAYDETDDGRVRAVPYGQISRFVPGDRVWYRESGVGEKQGPYIVANVPTAGNYQLAAIHDVQVLVLSGRAVRESELLEAEE